MLNEINKNNIINLLNLIDKSRDEIETIFLNSFDSFPSSIAEPITTIQLKSSFIRTELDSLTDSTTNYKVPQPISYKTENNMI